MAERSTALADGVQPRRCRVGAAGLAALGRRRRPRCSGMQAARAFADERAAVQIEAALTDATVGR